MFQCPVSKLRPMHKSGDQGHMTASQLVQGLSVHSEEETYKEQEESLTLARIVVG